MPLSFSSSTTTFHDRRFCHKYDCLQSWYVSKLNPYHGSVDGQYRQGLPCQTFLGLIGRLLALIGSSTSLLHPARARPRIRQSATTSTPRNIKLCHRVLFS